MNVFFLVIIFGFFIIEELKYKLNVYKYVKIDKVI